MSIKVVLLSDFDCEKLSVGKAKVNISGIGKSASTRYEGRRFYLAITDTRFPFGASAKNEEYRKATKDQWSLQCELSEEQINVFKNLDERVIDECLNNQEIVDCLVPKGKKATKEILESKYFSILKYSKINQEYPPTIRVTIPNNASDGFNCSFFSSSLGAFDQIKVNNIPENADNIGKFLSPRTKGSVLVGMSVWVTNTSFGVTLRANQIKGETAKQESKKQCLLDLL